jgi:hypothetical protein
MAFRAARMTGIPHILHILPVVSHDVARLVSLY